MLCRSGAQLMTFGSRVLCKRNPWRRPVIKFKYYYRNALFSSIQLLFYAASFLPREINLLRHVCKYTASSSVKKGLFSSEQHRPTLRTSDISILKVIPTSHSNSILVRQ